MNDRPVHHRKGDPHVIHQAVAASELVKGDVLAYPLALGDGTEVPAGSTVTSSAVDYPPLNPTEHHYTRMQFDNSMPVAARADAVVRILPRRGPVGDLAFTIRPPERRPGFVHNVIGHPLLWLWPRVGQWIHRRSRP